MERGVTAADRLADTRLLLRGLLQCIRRLGHVFVGHGGGDGAWKERAWRTPNEPEAAIHEADTR